MKILLCLIACFMLFGTSCSKPNDEPPLPSANDTSPPLPSANDTSDRASDVPLSVGMTDSDLIALKVDCVCFHQYVFQKSEDRKCIRIGEYGKDSNRLETVTELTAPVPTPEAFASITNGMAVLDVIYLVGIPQRNATFGLDTLDFHCENQAIYRIQWDNNLKVTDINRIA